MNRKTIQDALFAHVIDNLDDFRDGETIEATTGIPGTKFDIACTLSVEVRAVPPVQRQFADGDGDDWEDLEPGYVEGVTIRIEALTLIEYSDGPDEEMEFVLQSPQSYTFYRPCE